MRHSEGKGVFYCNLSLASTGFSWAVGCLHTYGIEYSFPYCFVICNQGTINEVSSAKSAYLSLYAESEYKGPKYSSILTRSHFKLISNFLPNITLRTLLSLLHSNSSLSNISV